MEQKQKFNVEVTLDELNLVLAGLAELPYKASSPIIQNLVEQYQKAIAPPAVAE